MFKLFLKKDKLGVSSFFGSVSQEDLSILRYIEAKHQDFEMECSEFLNTNQAESKLLGLLPSILLDSRDGGKFYGQIICLGHLTYRSGGNESMIPIGVSNQKYNLISKPKTPSERWVLGGIIRLRPNLSPIVQDEIIHYPVSDVYQFGRSREANDCIVGGMIGGDSSLSGHSSNTVKRHSFRIVCDIHSPYKCRIFACGFNKSQILELPTNAVQWMNADGTLDGIATLGVYVWNPSVAVWSEVTVKGSMLSTNPAYARERIRERCLDEVSNVLEDGSVISVGGCFFTFLGGECSLQPIILPKKCASVIDALNARLPQCPVLLQTIRFSLPLPGNIPQLRYWESIKQSYDVALRSSSIESVKSPASQLDSNPIPYVFPACGHVHGYSQELEGRPCPLCRTSGSFSPLSLFPDPNLTSDTPTHVFNPCGHAASLQFCEKWSKIPLARPSANHRFEPSDLMPHCPFCRITLHNVPMNGGHPFTRLIFQFEKNEDVSDTGIYHRRSDSNYLN